MIKTRARIISAATACDYEALEAIGREGGPEFSFSFGPDASAAALWREEEREGEHVLAQLVKLLDRRPYRDGDTYVWPSAAREGAMAEDWADLDGVYPARTIADMRQEGLGYMGLRVGIRADGSWRFAVGGD